MSRGEVTIRGAAGVSDLDCDTGDWNDDYRRESGDLDQIAS